MSWWSLKLKIILISFKKPCPNKYTEVLPLSEENFRSILPYFQHHPLVQLREAPWHPHSLLPACCYGNGWWWQSVCHLELPGAGTQKRPIPASPTWFFLIVFLHQADVENVTINLTQLLQTVSYRYATFWTLHICAAAKQSYCDIMLLHSLMCTTMREAQISKCGKAGVQATG